ncbi:MAG: hypothetical protein M3290_07365 [Actinomycetota bacterium]|nr:hypothetical protein [Actinomycetota bacterium]
MTPGALQTTEEPPQPGPVKTMPPGTVTLIHDDGTVSSLPDADEPSITYVVDELLAAGQRDERDGGALPD